MSADGRGNYLGADGALDDDQPFGWPPEDAPGRYEITCSCGRWTFTGTVPEINAASRRHDDSPRRNHVVVVMHGGRRIDRGVA